MKQNTKKQKTDKQTKEQRQERVSGDRSQDSKYRQVLPI